MVLAFCRHRIYVYTFFLDLSGGGISGSSFTQKVSETSQDLTRAIITSAINLLFGSDYGIIITKIIFIYV